MLLGCLEDGENFLKQKKSKTQKTKLDKIFSNFQLIFVVFFQKKKTTTIKEKKDRGGGGFVFLISQSVQSVFTFIFLFKFPKNHFFFAF